MNPTILQGIEILTGSTALQIVSKSVPVAIAVSGLAGWRAQVPNTLPLAIWGIALCLWIFPPLSFATPELGQYRNFVSLMGWLWLVQSWGRLVLSEWPAPIWSHWVVGTLLMLLPVLGAVALIRGL